MKQNRKKAIAILLLVTMLFTILPTAALATDVTPNPITGVQIRDTNNAYNELSSGTYYLIDSDTGKPETDGASEGNYHVFYDANEKTLTLNGAVLKGTLFVPGGTIVELVGTNSVGTESDKVNGSGIEVDSAGSLTVQGDGSLATYCTTEAITNTQQGGNITIREATLTLTEWQTSIYSRFGSITITDGAKVTGNYITCSPTSENCDGDGHIVISGEGTTVTAVAINTSDGKITISEKAVVEAINNRGAAISGQTGVEAKTGAKVTAKGSTGAISAFQGDLDLDGEVYAELTGSGNNAALSVSGNNSINIKGKLTLISPYTGAWAPGLGNITIDGGEVTVTALYGFITRINGNTDATANGGNLIIKNGSKVSITGAMGVYMLQNKGVLTLDSSTLEINSSSWGIYNGGEIKLINSTVTCTPTATTNKAINTSKIDYQYDNGYSFKAGDDADSTAEIPMAEQTANLQKKYVKIMPKDEISLIVNEPQEYIYDGTMKEFKLPEDALDGFSVAYKQGEDDITAPTNAGSYDVVITRAEDENYKAYSKTIEEGLVIKPKTIGSEIALTAPVKYEAPQTSIETDEYTATVAWSPEVTDKFATRTEYTATITITPKANYMVAGIAENSYTVDGATSVSNEANGNVVTVVFPKTAGSSGSVTATYTVKFDTNGGSTIKNQTVTEYQKAKEPTAPTKDGYTFAGWYSDKELTKAYDFSAKVTKSMTLYAKWIVNDEENANDNKEQESNPTTSEWQNPFTDVKADDWFYNAVKYAHQNGLMGGMTTTTFAPNTPLTRGMLVTILYRMEGSPTVTGDMPFADVNASAYYHNAILWAVQNNIVSGIADDLFAPDVNITREQLAAILQRYAQYKGYDTTQGGMQIREYNDYESISGYALNAMTWAVNSGLLKGKGENNIAPQDTATRAEVAAILQRFIESNK